MDQLTPVLSADNDQAIARAADLLRDGRLVAFPTETVYGLGADAADDRAVAKIYEVKQRPSFNPLIVHFADQAALSSHIEWNDRAERLAAEFWPGPLTLVLQRQVNSSISKLASAGLDTLAVRVPDHPVAAALLRAAHRPIAAPSANPAGAMSPTTAQHVYDGLSGNIDLILDDGRCQVGLESTVVNVRDSTPQLLRPGGITEEQLVSCLGGHLVGLTSSELRSPGMLSRHYSPSTPLRLDVEVPQSGEILLGFGPDCPATPYNLSRAGDLIEAAANLFAILHAIDVQGAHCIAVAPIPDIDLGKAINDRLRRAAATV